MAMTNHGARSGGAGDGGGKAGAAGGGDRDGQSGAGGGGQARGGGDVHAVAVGPNRALFMSTADGSLLSMPLAMPAAAEQPVAVACTPKAHK